MARRLPRWAEATRATVADWALQRAVERAVAAMIMACPVDANGDHPEGPIRGSPPTSRYPSRPGRSGPTVERTARRGRAPTSRGWSAGGGTERTAGDSIAKAVVAAHGSAMRTRSASASAEFAL